MHRPSSHFCPYGIPLQGYPSRGCLFHLDCTILPAAFLEPDKDTATALLYGMKMDALQFTRGVTELDIEMFAFLFPLCDQEKLSRLERNNMEFSDLKAYGHLCGLSGLGCAPWVRRWRRTRRNGGLDDMIGKRTSAGALSQRRHPGYIPGGSAVRPSNSKSCPGRTGDAVC